MVKKLFQYEFKSYLRTLIPVNLILLAIAVFARLIQFFETDSIPYMLLFGSSISAYAISIMVALILTGITVVVRFYKNLFTAEGYLTFTLPVTATQHILIKLFTGFLVETITTVSVFLSAMIITSGDVLVELFKATGYILKSVFMLESSGHIVFFAIEILLNMIVSSLFQTIVLYTCIALGQRSSKNRILMAVVYYFAYYMISQAVSTVLTIIFTVIAETDLMEAIAKIFINHPFGTIHTVSILSLLATAGFGVLGFFIIKKTIEHRLNLE